MLDFVLDFEAALSVLFVPVLFFLARSNARDVMGLKSVNTLSLLALKVPLPSALEAAWMLEGALLVFKCDA